ncbi:MAG: HepT-like ribonuclease domain-containing protein [Thermoanaerobaculia bacterium]
MREQAVRLIKLLEGIDEAMFLSNEDVRLVAERRIEIIGDAASHVSSQLRSQTPKSRGDRLLANGTF